MDTSRDPVRRRRGTIVAVAATGALAVTAGVFGYGTGTYDQTTPQLWSLPVPVACRG